jgi:hypothetical protein
VSRAAVLLPILCLAGCPGVVAPPDGPAGGGGAAPALPPAVLAAPSWVLLLRPAELLAAPAVRTMTRGLGIDVAVDEFVAGAAFDLTRLGTVRVESDAGRSLFVLPAGEAAHLAQALTLQQLRGGGPGEGSPTADLQVVTETAGEWAVVYRVRAAPEPGAGLRPRADDPEGARLGRLLRRVEGAAAALVVRGPFEVRAELDPMALLARSEAIGCAVRPEPGDVLRLGCVLFGVRGEDLSAAVLQRFTATVFDSTLGMILDLQGAAAEETYDPEPGAPYVEAVLQVEKLLPGLEVLASVPLAHIFGGEGAEGEGGEGSGGSGDRLHH